MKLSALSLSLSAISFQSIGCQQPKTIDIENAVYFFNSRQILSYKAIWERAGSGMTSNSIP